MAYLDLRDLAEEWQDLDPRDDAERISALRDLCAELGCEPTADGLREQGEGYEPTMIPESEFVEYARELAEDIGAVPTDAAWPAYCIDWERAARDLRVDYSSVSFDGTDYLIRS